jgi:hypothetical protein
MDTSCLLRVVSLNHCKSSTGSCQVTHLPLEPIQLAELTSYWYAIAILCALDPQLTWRLLSGHSADRYGINRLGWRTA